MKVKTGSMLLVLLLVATLSSPSSAREGRGAIEELMLFSSPPAAHGAGRRHGVSGGSHSEYRAVPIKRLYLNTHSVSENAKVFVVRPDGTVQEAGLNHDEHGLSVLVDTKPVSSVSDGIFNVYVVDREIKERTLLVRVAKMSVINHSCGWGHKYKYDKKRLNPEALNRIPLEIVGRGLWDKNFHVKTMSGDTLSFNLLSNGRPAEGASVRIRTQSGWEKRLKADEKGEFQVQLIRDYYPEEWSLFNRSKRSNFILTATYEREERGEFSGKQYNKVRFISTFLWRYQPQKREYTSYAYGLTVMTLFALFSGIGVYIFRERRKTPSWEVMFDEKG